MKILKIRNCDKKCADFRLFIINGIITHSQSDCIIYIYEKLFGMSSTHPSPKPRAPNWSSRQRHQMEHLPVNKANHNVNFRLTDKKAFLS